MSTKVSEDVAVDIERRGFGLSSESDHFLHGRWTGNDVKGLVGDAAQPKSFLRLCTPRAERFDKESDILWFHGCFDRGWLTSFYESSWLAAFLSVWQVPYDE